MKILTVVGARPQFIKAAPISTAIRRQHYETLVHTGQHYDGNLSAVFFEQLGLPIPNYNLGVGSGTHGWQTGQMLTKLEEVMLAEMPDWVLVYGDTNSTLAGALAAAKLHLPLAHVEAGLRSFNWEMPEEINRVLTDRCSQALFCPTKTAQENLFREGIRDGVYVTGDVMYDAVMQFSSSIDDVLVTKSFRVAQGDYILATVHRAENTDSRANLAAVLACLAASPWPVLLPLHPRTKSALERYDLHLPNNVRALPPAGYLQMLALEKNARYIMTDSGGVQKEAYILGVPCITLRDETEWVETVASGWNTLAGRDPELIRTIVARENLPSDRPPLFGDGQAAQRIVDVLAGGTRS